MKPTAGICLRGANADMVPLMSHLDKNRAHFCAKVSQNTPKTELQELLANKNVALFYLVEKSTRHVLMRPLRLLRDAHCTVTETKWCQLWARRCSRPQSKDNKDWFSFFGSLRTQCVEFFSLSKKCLPEMGSIPHSFINEMRSVVNESQCENNRTPLQLLRNSVAISLRHLPTPFSHIWLTIDVVSVSEVTK